MATKSLKYNNRKQLKKKLARLKYYKAILPRLIDCSEIYGNIYYADSSDIDKQIKEVERQIAEIDIKNKEVAQ